MLSARRNVVLHFKDYLGDIDSFTQSFLDCGGLSTLIWPERSPRVFSGKREGSSVLADFLTHKENPNGHFVRGWKDKRFSCSLRNHIGVRFNKINSCL